LAGPRRSLDGAQRVQATRGQPQARLRAAAHREIAGARVGSARPADGDRAGGGAVWNRGGDRGPARHTRHRRHPVELDGGSGSEIVTTDRHGGAGRAGHGRERGDHGGLVRRCAGVHHVFQVGGHRRIHVGEKVQPGDGLDFLHGGDVTLPGAESRARVGREQGDHPAVGGDPLVGRGRAGGVGHLHDDFPNGGRHRHLVEKPVAREFRGPAKNQNFVPVCRQGAAVGFKISPQPLVVLRRLGNDIAHPESHLVVRHGAGAIGGRTHVATIPSFPEAAAKRGDAHPVISGGQRRLLGPGIRPPASSAIPRGVTPAHPVGHMIGAVVGHRVLGSRDQVVVCFARIGGGTAGIAQCHLKIDSLLGPRRAREKN